MKYMLSDFIHIFHISAMPRNNVRNYFPKASFSTVVTLLWMSSSGSKWDPFKGFIFKNTKNLMSQIECGGCCSTGIYFCQRLLQLECYVRRCTVLKQNSLLQPKMSFSTILETECMIECLFWRNKFVMDNSFDTSTKKSTYQHDFDASLWHVHFFSLGDPGFCHWILWHFVSGSYWETHVSSLITILF